MGEERHRGKEIFIYCFRAEPGQNEELGAGALCRWQGDKELNALLPVQEAGLETEQ